MTRKLLVGVITLLALILSACSTPAQTVPTTSLEPTSQPGNLPQTEADVPRVTVQKAKAAFDSGAAVIVDVRSIEAFASQRIKGALSIPLAGIEADPASVTLDKDQWIITYCT